MKNFSDFITFTTLFHMVEVSLGDGIVIWNYIKVKPILLVEQRCYKRDCKALMRLGI